MMLWGPTCDFFEQDQRQRENASAKGGDWIVYEVRAHGVAPMCKVVLQQDGDGGYVCATKKWQFYLNLKELGPGGSALPATAVRSSLRPPNVCQDLPDLSLPLWQGLWQGLPVSLRTLRWVTV
jgi:hypothetical protein